MIWIWIIAEAAVLLLLALMPFFRKSDGKFGAMIKILGIVAALTIDVIIIKLSDGNMGIKATAVLSVLFLLMILQNIGNSVPDEEVIRDADESANSYDDEDEWEDI